MLIYGLSAVILRLSYFMYPLMRLLVPQVA